MDTLDSVLKKITDAENEQKSRKRSYNDTIQAGGQGGGQVGCPWAQMRELWNGTFYLHIQEKQVGSKCRLFTIRRECDGDRRRGRGCLVGFSASERPLLRLRFIACC